MATTWQGIVDGALKELAVLGAGDSATAEETADALDTLIDWLDQQSIHGLMQSERSRQTHTFTESKLEYTIGATGDRDIAYDLPAELHMVEYHPVTSTDGYPLDQISLRAMARYRSNNSTEPFLFVLEHGDPTRILFDARPLAGDELLLVGGTWLTAERSAIEPGNEINLARGYERTLKLNLAMELAEAYGVQVSRMFMRRADDSMEVLRARNIEPFTVEFDKGLLHNDYSGIS